MRPHRRVVLKVSDDDNFINPGPSLHGSTIKEIVAERDQLRAELQRWRPVIEAAKTWRAAHGTASADLRRAVDAALAGEES